MSIVIGLVSVLALLLWPVVFGWNFSLHDSDPAGDGLAQVYTVVGTIVLWALLGLAVLLTSLRGTIPAWSGMAAMILVPLSGAAAVAVTVLLADREPLRWMLAIQALVPPLILALVTWPSIPRFSVIVWSVVFVLGLLPWSSLMTHSERQQQRVEVMEAESAARFARFHQLTPASPVRDWMQFLDASYGLHDEAARGIKGLAHKQTDIEHMLNSGDYTGFESLWEFDLLPTPELCEGVRKFLRDQSIALKPGPAHPSFRDIEAVANSYEYTVRWFVKQGCPMRDELDALAMALRGYPDVGAGALFLAALDEIRK